MINKSLFTSNSEEWETPQLLFDELNEEFNFTWDVCATKENSKCGDNFWSKTISGLTNDWGEVNWMNPPYGRDIGIWVRKAYMHAKRDQQTTVALLPARTDTKWFHDYIYKKKNVEIRFLKGRLKFSNSKNSAPFPSMIVIYR